MMPEEPVDFSAGRSIADDLAGVVDRAGFSPAEVHHPSVLPEDRVLAVRPDDLTDVIDPIGRSRAQVGHRAALPEEGMHDARRDIAGPDDLARVIDRVRRAEGSSGEGPEVRHVALVP